MADANIGPQPDQRVVFIDGYPIDATLSEDHSLETEVTEYPVETGSDVTDNVRNKPIKVTLECIVTNTPMGFYALDASRNGVVPSTDIYQRFKKIRDDREPITISDSLDTYDNMVLVTLSIPRAADTGSAFHFTATFQQVIFVTNNRATVRVSSPSGAAKRDLGNPLGLKGNERRPGWTAVGTATYKFKPLITDPAGSHYLTFLGSPPPDGYFDAKGFHSMFTVVKSNFDPSTGIWTDATYGTVNKISPIAPAPGSEQANENFFTKLVGQDAPDPSSPSNTTQTAGGLVGKPVPSVFGG